MKKFLILLTILFSVFLINNKNVKAYGEEVSPMLDLNALDISFDNIDENDSRYSNLIAARNFVKENNISNYIITPYYYNNSCNNTSCTKTKTAFSSKERLLNGSSPESVLDLSNAISLIVFDNSVSTMNTDIAKSNYYYYFEYTISHSYNYKMIYFYDNGNSMYGDLDYNFTDNYLQHRISSSTSYKKFILPYLESDIKGTYFTKNYVGNAMSRTTYYSSVKYNDLIYNEGDLFINFNNNDFASPIPEPTFEYEIGEGTEKGKKLSLFFNNYKETDYAIINNYQTGEEIKILDLKNNSTKIFDNISQDNTFIVVIYNENDEIILIRNIDIQEQLRLSGERYILVGGLNIQELNSYFLAFYNTEKDDKCFYKFKNEEEQEIDCNDESIVIKSPNKNTYVENYIKNKKGEIIVRKNVNLNYLKNLPQFKFESYFNDKENKQILEIIVENLQESDIISYSYDNEYWYRLDTKRINYLDFYNSTDVYFKVERNSEIVSEAYFDVVYNSYVNSSNNNNLENTNFSFKNLLNNFKIIANKDFTLLKKGTEVYNQLKNSSLGLYLTIIITGSFIILIVKSMKR